MGSLSDFFELVSLDLILGPTTRGANASYTVPATVYVALATAAPTDATTGTTLVEPTSAEYTGYARVAITNNATNFPAASAGSKTHASAITFPASTAGTGATVTHFALLDALTLGNVICWGALGASKLINSGITPQFSAGALTFTQD